MKMRRHLLFCAGALLFAVGADGAAWLTDLPTTLTRAKSENKLVLINFTGSDWCPTCIKMKEQVFSSAAFDQYAANNLYLVEVDFPRRKAQSAEQKRVNQALSDKYGVDAYPTMLLLNGDGTKVGELKRLTSPETFVPHLKELVAANSPVTATRTAKPQEPAGPLPLWGGAPPAPPPKYADLTLKNLSGPRNRRLALINNQTFAAGESALVRLGDGQVKVRCLEIRDDAVRIQVDGQEQSRELRLAQKP